jgi:predicted GIY-YIG superfamily endonuclease
MNDHEYFVYIMSSRSGTLYIGMTNSIYRRALQHKSGEIEGFASKYHCNRLVYYEMRPGTAGLSTPLALPFGKGKLRSR